MAKTIDDTLRKEFVKYIWTHPEVKEYVHHVGVRYLSSCSGSRSKPLDDQFSVALVNPPEDLNKPQEYKGFKINYSSLSARAEPLGESTSP